MTHTLPAGQVWDADDYARTARFVADHGETILAMLNPQLSENILDLGCGDGALTERLAQSGAHVTGLEPDPSMAKAARSRGLSVLEQDAHVPFGSETFEAVFSNAALHWMRTPDTVIKNVFTALKPGGRFVAEQGGFGNVASICVAMEAAMEKCVPYVEIPTPWDFPTPQLQTERLEAAGFRVSHMALVPRQTPVTAGFEAWLKTMGGPYLSAVPIHLHATVIQDAARRLHRLVDPAGTAVADYVRLRFAAIKS
ncbi:MAG: class I SAM-dependent methyltransferase [Pseudomonadota bacterium]